MAAKTKQKNVYRYTLLCSFGDVFNQSWSKKHKQIANSKKLIS